MTFLKGLWLIKGKPERRWVVGSGFSLGKLRGRWRGRIDMIVSEDKEILLCNSSLQAVYMHCEDDIDGNPGKLCDFFDPRGMGTSSDNRKLNLREMFMTSDNR